MSKWHDLTMATGDPQDLPTGRDIAYLATLQGANDYWTDKVWWDNDWFDRNTNDGRRLCNVIAWREMPRAYVPGKRKPTRFVHTCEIRDGQEPQSIKIGVESGASVEAGSEAWRTMADTMWGAAAREYIEQTRVGESIPVRVTVEMG